MWSVYDQSPISLLTLRCSLLMVATISLLSIMASELHVRQLWTLGGVSSVERKAHGWMFIYFCPECVDLKSNFGRKYCRFIGIGNSVGHPRDRRKPWLAIKTGLFLLMLNWSFMNFSVCEPRAVTIKRGNGSASSKYTNHFRKQNDEVSLKSVFHDFWKSYLLRAI